MLRAGGARMKRRNVWNSLFRSLPSKVCFWGDMFLYFLLASCVSPYGPTCCLSSPSLLSSPASFPAFRCYLFVSLFPMSFQSSNWFFYSVPPSPSILYPHSTSMYLPFPGISLSVFPLLGPCGTAYGKTMDIYLIFSYPIPLWILLSFSFCFSIHWFLCSFIYSSHKHTWDPIREQALD